MPHDVDSTERGYAREQEPKSARQKADQLLFGLIKQPWPETCALYGYRKTILYLRPLWENFG